MVETPRIAAVNTSSTWFGVMGMMSETDPSLPL